MGELEGGAEEAPAFGTTPFESMKVTITESGVVTATLDRPERLNAFDGGLRRSLRRLIDSVRADDAAKVLVITGAGRGFCSGADLTAEDRSPVPAHPTDSRFQWCADLLELPKPTIAAINGVAAGGGFGFSLLCDIRIASTNARLIPIWLKRAIHPDDLVTWTLPRLVGYSRALQWLYLAEDIPLEEAKLHGVVSDIVAPSELMPTAMALAERLASGPTMHHGLTKRAVLAATLSTPSEASRTEEWGQQRAWASEDYKEGIAAFRERRPPRFIGR